MEDRYDFHSIEPNWQQRWAENRVFEAPDLSPKPKFYALEMFAYPSGAGLHGGHVKNYVPTDAFCRYKRMKGYNVLYPTGWDAFGQPAENEAIKRGRNPREMVTEYATSFRRTMQRLGLSYDWTREINTSDESYYRWTQWFFLLLYKRGLAYRSTAPINWCPTCKTGLANEEVKEGRCWRCDSVIEKRPMPQWYFKITEYADRLESDLATINWPESVKQMQREWIGRSDGAEIDFSIAGSHEHVRIFTTRPDTVFGSTFIVLAPEHPLVPAFTTSEQRGAVDEYIRKASKSTEIERMNSERTKTGVFVGAYAINPATQERIPIWIADYVLMGYGTGAIMAVPAHDQRDFEFARKFRLPVRLVLQSTGGPVNPEEMKHAQPEGGMVVNSGDFDGLPEGQPTRLKFTTWLATIGKGRERAHYKLRDWLISRQRYWGAPIPIIHCSVCGPVPVPESQLPVLLPGVESYQPSGTGESPLATIPGFVNTACPTCGGAARRETDTMGGFACSSWYFLRFADPANSDQFASRNKLDHWLPVDLYTGGTEHAVMHLLYARFWTKVMYDAGLVSFTEPFRQLRNQGTMLAYTPGRRPRPEETAGSEGDNQLIDWIVLKPEERIATPEEHIIWRWARMSKSKGNGIQPDKVIDQHGADAVRVYVLFVAPFEEDVQWSEDGLTGASRFVNRLWRWLNCVKAQYTPSWREQLVGRTISSTDRRIRRKLHQTIRKLSIDIDNFSFNTSVAALMELLNDLYAYRNPETGTDSEIDVVVVSEIIDNLLLMLSPFAPHLAEEMWSRVGHEGLVCQQDWPQFDTAAATEDEVTLVVQVNGKLRDRLTVPAGTDRTTLERLALASSRVKEWLAQKEVRRVLVVQDKLINIVAN